MKAQTVNVRVSTGKILGRTVYRPDGKKLLATRHVISEDDISILESEGMDKVWVTELEDEEIGEDEAVSMVPGRWDAAATRSIWPLEEAPTCTQPRTAACWWTMTC